MKPFGIPSMCLGVTFASMMAFRGARKKSLSTPGAIAAWCVGFLIVSTGLRGFVLVCFYIVGTKATKYRHNAKMKIDASAAQGSVRGVGQVLAASFIAVTCSLLHAWYCGEEQDIDFEKAPVASALSCAVLAHHATCLADTLASEMGILANDSPLLITKPWKHVPAGTNGAITWTGTCWSAIGGAMMGFCTAAMDVLSGLSPSWYLYIVFGAICGLLGSLVDSLLGATLQASYWDPETKLAYASDNMPAHAKHISGINLLSNAQVNLASVIILTLAGAYGIGPAVFS